MLEYNLDTDDADWCEVEIAGTGVWIFTLYFRDGLGDDRETCLNWNAVAAHDIRTLDNTKETATRVVVEPILALANVILLDERCFCEEIAMVALVTFLVVGSATEGPLWSFTMMVLTMAKTCDGWIGIQRGVALPFFFLSWCVGWRGFSVLNINGFPANAHLWENGRSLLLFFYPSDRWGQCYIEDTPSSFAPCKADDNPPHKFKDPLTERFFGYRSLPSCASSIDLDCLPLLLQPSSSSSSWAAKATPPRTLAAPTPTETLLLLNQNLP